MTARIALMLPLPPSVNGLHTGTGLSKRRHPNYNAWLQEAGWRINELRLRLAVRALPDAQPYRARMRWPRADGADADNRVKALLDLLVAMRVTPDDRWLEGGSFGRSDSVPPGLCSVVVWSIPTRRTA